MGPRSSTQTIAKLVPGTPNSYVSIHWIPSSFPELEKLNKLRVTSRQSCMPKKWGWVHANVCNPECLNPRLSQSWTKCSSPVQLLLSHRLCLLPLPRGMQGTTLSTRAACHPAVPRPTCLAHSTGFAKSSHCWLKDGKLIAACTHPPMTVGGYEYLNTTPSRHTPLWPDSHPASLWSPPWASPLICIDQKLLGTQQAACLLLSQPGLSTFQTLYEASLMKAGLNSAPNFQYCFDNGLF